MITTAKRCLDCGHDFSPVSKRPGARKFCDECVMIRRRQKKSKYYRTWYDKARRPNDAQRQVNEALRRQRISASKAGVPNSPEHRLAVATTLRRLYAEGKLKPSSTPCSPELREHLRQTTLQAYKEGRLTPTGSYKNKWSLYEGVESIRMRSKSEVLFAQYLDSIKMAWWYEPERFDLGWSTYTPDFYLPELDHWIEVKGQWTEVSLRKFADFGVDHRISAVLAKDILRFNTLQST